MRTVVTKGQKPLFRIIDRLRRHTETTVPADALIDHCHRLPLSAFEQTVINGKGLGIDLGFIGFPKLELF